MAHVFTHIFTLLASASAQPTMTIEDHSTAVELCTVVLLDTSNFEVQDKINAVTCDEAYKRCLLEIKKGLECYRQ